MSAMSKLASERNQKALLELASKPGNDVCADCKARNPRWTSHNLGIFICMNCASIHRKIGTHITKVKSLTMDVWSNDQLDVMRNMGNVKSNAIFNPNELRNPPPANIEDGTRDSEMEKYIRAKYEYRKYIDKNALVASKLGPSRSSTSIPSASNSLRSVSSPLASSSAARSSTVPPSSSTSAASKTPSSNLSNAPVTSSSPIPQSHSTPLTVSAPSGSRPGPQARSVSQPVIAPAQLQQPQGGVWNDLVQLQGSTPSASLPLQYQQQPTMAASPLQASYTPAFSQTGLVAGNAGPIAMQRTGMAPFNPFQQQLQQQQQQQAVPQQQFQSILTASSPFTPSFQFSQTQQTPQSSFGQQLFMNQTGQPLTPGIGTANAQQFFQPQPQSASSFQPQQQQQQQGFLTPSPSISMQLHSAPATQTQFMTTPSPNGQQFLSHSPQLQMGSMQGHMQPQATGMYGAGLTPSPQPMGMMGMGGGSPAFGGVQQQQQQQGGMYGNGMMQQQQQPQQPMNLGDQFLSGLAAMGPGGGQPQAFGGGMYR